MVIIISDPYIDNTFYFEDCYINESNTHKYFANYRLKKTEWFIIPQNTLEEFYNNLIK
jgi:hypothetical protein